MNDPIKFYRSKLTLTTQQGNIAYYYNELMYVIYENAYCWLYFSDGKSYNVDVPLKYIMENIPQQPFFKCNRKEIINLCYYKEYQEYPSTVVLENEKTFKLSARNITPFKKKKAGLYRLSPLCPKCYDCPENETCSDFQMFCLPHKPVTQEEIDER
ncbi:MAG: LytTR family transcriptional regulator [Tannerella sp.]|jgi:DNA-binding LytR/AlgR family response regulator|nr:LytTR family transcriptional regulator [Tannerella sp.]